MTVSRSVASTSVSQWTPPAEIVHDQADVSILVAWHNRGRPCVTHNATPDARSGAPQANSSAPAGVNFT
jgi:hypothetical protein